MLFPYLFEVMRLKGYEVIGFKVLRRHTVRKVLTTFKRSDLKTLLLSEFCIKLLFKTLNYLLHYIVGLLVVHSLLFILEGEVDSV